MTYRTHKHASERLSIPRVQDSGKLQSNDNENESVEKEHDHFPKGISLEPGPCGDHQRRVPAEKNAGSNCRQNARGMRAFGGQISDEGRKQRECDLDWWIIEMALHPAHRYANKQSNSDATCRRPHKPPRRIRRRESAGNEGGNRKLQCNQRGGIIHETLALEDHLYPMRNAEPANNRRRRNRIWRGNNCSEGKRSRPWKRRHNEMRDPRNCEHCCQHQPDGEQEYRAQISPEITPGCEQRGRINQRRKNKVEHNVRIQIHRRQSRHETQSESAKDEHDRIRQRDLVRQHGQNPDDRE